jgi:hypothetical protein
MKITTAPAAGTAIAAAAITLAAVSALPAVAHAQDSNHQKFASPSGNIRCVLTGEGGPTPIALCQIENKAFSVPPGSGRDQSGAPCPSGTGSGNDFRLDQGQPGFIRCSFAALDGGVGPWPTLANGQSRSLGAITCDNEPSGVTCTDVSTGHFFRVSRESYELG